MTKGGGTLGRSLLIPFSLMPKKQKPLQKKGFFLWRRERDSSGDIGAVSPPARGTKKPFTGWFFASPCSAVPFSSLSLLCPKSKNPFKRRGFSFGAEKGIRPAILGQYRRQPGELKKYSLDTFCPSGRSLRVPLISYQPQKKSPWLNTNSVSGAARQSKSEPFLLLIASCNSAKVMVFVPSL